MTLFIYCGIPFSGKSVLSKKLAKTYGIVRIDLDEIKTAFLGNVMDEVVTQPQWDEVYQEMYRRIEANLRSYENVLQDAGNFIEYERGLVAKIGENCGARVVTVFVNTPVEVARERWQKNRQTSERFNISEESLSGGIAELQPPPLSEDVIWIDGTLSTDEQVKQIHDKFLR